MKNSIIKKGLILGIIVLFIGSGVIPSTIGIIEKRTTFVESNSRGYIQGLIDNASNGDTIYIHSGTYYENIVINKSINLIGEDKNTTIIDGSESGDVVNVTADWVKTSGFTIKNSGNQYGDSGIQISSNYNNITRNIISDDGRGINLDEDSSNNTIRSNVITSNNQYGICLGKSRSNNITGNTLTHNHEDGVYLWDSKSNTITGNIIISNNGFGIYIVATNTNNITDNTFFNDSLYVHFTGNNVVENNTVNGKPLVYLEDESDKVIDFEVGQVILVNCDNIIVENLNLSSGDVGIELFKTDNSTISNNDCSNNDFGIYLRYSNSNTITNNKITSNNKYGIYLLSNSNTIQNNNFLDNEIDAFFSGQLKDLLFKRNRWTRNYWNRPRILPKLILGQIPGLNAPGAPPVPPSPWLNIDWRPALKPYDI